MDARPIPRLPRPGWPAMSGAQTQAPAPAPASAHALAQAAPQAPAPAGTDAAPAPPRTRLVWIVVRVAVVATALGLTWLTTTRWNEWVGGRAVQETNDAYLFGDLTPLSARVAGIVTAVPVTDFQEVRAGQVLAQIEDRDYSAQLRQSEATLAGAEAQLANARAQRELQETNIRAAAAGVEQQQAAMARDVAEADRQRNLLNTGIAGTRQLVERADASARETQANLTRAQATVQGTVRQLAVLDAQVRQAEANRDAQAALVELAHINLGYTRITAPADGTVGQRQVRPGQFVAVGTQIIAVVPRTIWVVANYKETQVGNMAPGQPVELRVDALPGRALRGHVDTFSPASGSQFSLLPADNATGNFTKVVQRIPVRILLDDLDGVADRLRPGMSVVTRVDTRGGGGAAQGGRATPASGAPAPAAPDPAAK